MRLFQFLSFIFLLSIIFFHTAVAQGPGFDSTLMHYEIKGMPAGQVKLIGMLGEQRFIADSAMADAKGHFSLTRKSPLEAGYYYWLGQGGKNFSLLLDGADQRFTMKGDLADLTTTFSIEGGGLDTKLFYETTRYQVEQGDALDGFVEEMKKNDPASEAYKKAKKQKDDLMDERESYLQGIYKKYPDAFFTRFKIAGQNPPVNDFRKPNGDLDTLRQLMDYRDHFWDGVDFSDERLLATPVIANKLKRYILELTPQNVDSLLKVVDPLIQKVIPYPPYFKFFANWIALKFENTKTNVMGGEGVYVHVVQNYFTDKLATWDTPENLEKLRKHVWEMEASLLNKKGPDVEAADILTGEMRSIYAIKEPVVVVFMYSPDCEHCQKEAPEIERLYKKWKPKGVDFFGIGVNSEADKLKEFVQEQRFTFPTVYDPTNRAIYAKYYVDITPELYVLDKDRMIIAKNLKPEQLEYFFEKELGK